MTKTPLWKHIMKETGCSPRHARSASKALTAVAQCKGTALTMPDEVCLYMGEYMAEMAAHIIEEFESEDAS